MLNCSCIDYNNDFGNGNGISNLIREISYKDY